MKLKETEDPRQKMNINTTQVIPSKENLGLVIKYREDDGPEDHINRMQPDLISSQLTNNPFHINSSKMI